MSIKQASFLSTKLTFKYNLQIQDSIVKKSLRHSSYTSWDSSYLICINCISITGKKSVWPETGEINKKRKKRKVKSE